MLMHAFIKDIAYDIKIAHINLSAVNPNVSGTKIFIETLCINVRRISGGMNPKSASRQMIHRLISNTRGKNSIKFELRPWREEKKYNPPHCPRVRIKPLDKVRNENYASTLFFILLICRILRRGVPQ